MVNNRFSQRAQLRSTYQPIQPTVNFDLLARSLQHQQTGFDEALEGFSKSPEYIRQSELASSKAEEFRNSNKVRERAMRDAYLTGGIQKGNIARKQAMLDLKGDFAPGGIANRLETDYKSLQEYSKRINDNKDITAEVKQAALSKSLKDYEQGFPNGSTFSGYEAQKYVDVQAKLDKLADGFESDVRQGKALVNGRQIGKTMNGSYYYVDSNKEEEVKASDIRSYVMNMAYTDPEIRSFNIQEDELFGGEFDYNYLDKDGNQKTQKMSRSDYSLNTIADGLASKYGFLKQTTDTQYKQDWQLKQRRDQTFQKALQTDPVLQRADLLIKKVDGIKPVTKGMWDKTTTQKDIDKQLSDFSQMTRAEINSSPTLSKEYNALIREKSRIANMPENKQVAAEEFIKWSNTPEGKEQFPGFYESYASKPFITDDKQNSEMLPVDERLELAMNRYNAVVDHSNTQVVKQTEISGDTRKKLNYNMLGDGTYGGDLGSRTMYPYDPTSQALGDPTSLSKSLKDMNLTEEQWEDYKKNFSVISQIDPDSPGIPGGVRMHGFLPNDKGDNIEVDFIIGTPDIQTANFYKEFGGFYANQRNPLKDHGYGIGFGEPIEMVAPNGERKILITEVVPQFQGDRKDNGGFTGTTKKVYEFDPTTGNKVESSLDYNSVELYIRNSNPFKKY